MSFKLFVKNAGVIPSIQKFFVDVTIESGVIKGGEIAVVEGHPEKTVAIKSVSLIGGGKPDQETITLSVERPSFAIEELLGQHLRDG